MAISSLQPTLLHNAPDESRVKASEADVHIRSQLLSAGIGCALILAAISTAQQPAHTWDYGTSHGPSDWGDLSPEFAPCGYGHHQSPIDIRNPQKADLPPLQFEYKPTPLHIIDNGHTIVINYAPGSSLTVGSKRYELKQFHFHRPSEEKINGTGFAMTIHLVHADAQGKLAVVAVLLQQGDDNPLVHEL
jgi:carbonic anhydrase